MSEKPSIFAELKRRNVYKVAVAYAVVSWLVVQAASLLFATFEAPPWAMKLFVVAVALGFPIALVLAWAFEITPEGIKLGSTVAPNDALTRRTGWRIVGITIALAVVAVMLFAFQLFRSHLTTAGVDPLSPAPLSAPRPHAIRSLAVLPLDNYSGD